MHDEQAMQGTPILCPSERRRNEWRKQWMMIQAPVRRLSRLTQPHGEIAMAVSVESQFHRHGVSVDRVQAVKPAHHKRKRKLQPVV